MVDFLKEAQNRALAITTYTDSTKNTNSEPGNIISDIITEHYSTAPKTASLTYGSTASSTASFRMENAYISEADFIQVRRACQALDEAREHFSEDRKGFLIVNAVETKGEKFETVNVGSTLAEIAKVGTTRLTDDSFIAVTSMAEEIIPHNKLVGEAQTPGLVPTTSQVDLPSSSVVRIISMKGVYRQGPNQTYSSPNPYLSLSGPIVIEDKRQG